MRTRQPLLPLVLVLALATLACAKPAPAPSAPAPAAPAPAAPAPAAPAPEAPKEAAPALRPLKIGLAIPSYVHAVAWLAAEKGFFAKHGIAAEIVTMEGSAPVMKGLLSGDLGVGLAGGDSAIKADLNGADLVAFGTLVNRHYHRLVVRGDVKTPDDLRGRTLGVPVLGGPQDFLIYVLCKKWGLAYGTDVKVQNVGQELAKLVAVSQGTVDGVTSAAPRAVIEPAPYLMLVASKRFLATDRALARDFLAALAEATEYYLADPAGALAVIADKMGPGAGDARQNYLEGGPLLYVLPPLPDKAAMQVALDYVATSPDFAEKARAFDLAAALDASLVEELVAAGTFTRAAGLKRALSTAVAEGKDVFATSGPGAR